MNRKWMLILILSVSVILVFSACGSGDNGNNDEGNNDEGNNNVNNSSNNDNSNNNNNNNNNASANDQSFKLDFATASVPGDVHTDGLYTFAEKVEELTDGQIEVQIHHSGSLFTQENERKALQRGDLDMAYMDPWTVSEFLPEVSMFTAGYIFNDYKHMLDVLNGEIGNELFERVAKETGVRPLAAYFKGNRQLNYRDVGKEIKKPEDLEGVILRMPNAKSWLFLGEALGAKPTPLDFGELYTALNSGTIDAQDNPLITVKSAKFYEVTDYITLTDHVVDNVWPTINEELWQKLGPDLQEKMIDAINIAGEEVSQNSADSEEELVQFFKDEGLTVVEADKEAFKDRVLSEYLDNKELTKDWDMDLFDQVQEAGK